MAIISSFTLNDFTLDKSDFEYRERITEEKQNQTSRRNSALIIRYIKYRIAKMAGGWLHETCYSPVNTDKNKCSSGSAANDMKDTVVDLNSNGDTTTHMNEDPSPRPHYTNKRNIMVALWTTCMILLTFVVAVIICLQHNRINDLQKQMETLSQFIVKNQAPAGLHLPLHHNASTVPPTSSSSVPEHLEVVTVSNLTFTMLKYFCINMESKGFEIIINDLVRSLRFV